MSGTYRPASTIQPGWHIRLAAPGGGEWVPVVLRLDTVTPVGQRRVWFVLGPGRVAAAAAADLVFSRTPDEA